MSRRPPVQQFEGRSKDIYQILYWGVNLPFLETFQFCLHLDSAAYARREYVLAHPAHISKESH